ncbi:MAG: PAS domain-containing protein [Myxococcales bacterium]|nr:PAS domain-containing protein [Myxococcales bacterium]
MRAPPPPEHGSALIIVDERGRPLVDAIDEDLATRLGIADSDVTGAPLADFLGLDDDSPAWAALRDGDRHHFVSHARDAEGRPGLLVVNRGRTLDEPLIATYVDLEAAILPATSDREAFFYALSESLPIGLFVTDARGVCNYVNPRCAAIIDLAPEQAFGFGWTTAFHPDDRQHLVDSWRRALIAGEAMAIEARIVRGDGEVRWISARAAIMRGAERNLGWVGLIDDISARRELDEARRNAEAALTSTLRSVGDLVFEIDTDERFVRFYQPDERPDLYRPPSDFIGKTLAEVLPPEVVDLARQATRDVAADGETHMIEYSLPMPDGDRWYQARVSAREGPDGAIAGYVLVARDATERRRHLAELQRRREEAEALASAAKAADAAKGQFLANMSHEMRTPLNAVIGLSSLLRETPLDPEQERFVGLITSSARALLGLVEDVLDFSRIDAGQLELTEEDYDLREVVEEALAPVSLRAARKGIALHERLDHDAPLALRGDPQRLRQILLNLLDNAVKFTDAGEVVIEAVRGARGGVVIAVRDTGIGIPDDRQQVIFEPFRQADGSTSRRYGGTGLGLAIVKRIADAGAMRLELSSTVGVGSTFTLTLPPAPAHALRVREPDLCGRRIAVVDRHADRRRWLAALLRSWGAELVLVGRPAELLHTRVDHLLLIDVRDPGLAAIEAWSAAAASPTQIATAVKVSDLAQPWVRTLRDRGVEIFALPLLRRRLAESLRASAEPETEVLVPTPAAPAGPCPRVLVVDDSDSSRLLAKALLERRGYEVSLACSGLEALDHLRTDDADVILMDCQMPGLDGPTTTIAIRRGDAGVRAQGLPIIALSANVTESDRCLRAGMNYYLSKPLNADALLNVIELMLDEPPPARPVPTLHRHRAPPPYFNSGRWRQLVELDEQVPGSLGELLESFVRESEACLEDVKQAGAVGDAAELRRLAHLLKGIARNVGADALAGRASALEALRDDTRAGALIDPLVDELRAVIAQLDARRSAAPTPAEKPREGEQ